MEEKAAEQKAANDTAWQEAKARLEERLAVVALFVNPIAATSALSPHILQP